MKVAISGASGLIGKALTHHLIQAHHEVVHVVRTESKVQKHHVETILWSSEGLSDIKKLENLDAFVCLNGENIGEKKWTPERKRILRESRIHTATFFALCLNELKSPPPLVVAGSAIGFYGSSEWGQPFTEKDQRRIPSFLSNLCKDWEKSWKSYQGGQVAYARTGVVISQKGGVLTQLLPPFQIGLGGPMGTGEQRMSLISLKDCVLALTFIIENKISGPVNLVTPVPVTHKELCQELARKIKRPCVFRVPKFLVRLAFGQLGQELILDDIAVSPHVLVENNFHYQTPTLKEMLAVALEEN